MRLFPHWYVPALTGATMGIAIGLGVIWVFFSLMAVAEYGIKSLGAAGAPWWMP